jgi:predicted dienelactone hydrolase
LPSLWATECGESWPRVVAQSATQLTGQDYPMKEASVMRLFETLTLIALLLSLPSLFVPRPKRPRWLAYLPGLAVLFALIHLALEGYRWQMVPAYGLTVLLFLGTGRGIFSGIRVRRDPPSRQRRVPKTIGTVLGLLVLIVAAALPALVPVFRLPKPTGPYAVGTQYFLWTDGARLDESTTDLGDLREVSVQIWYPAELSGGDKPIRYMRQDAGRAFAHFQDLPGFLLDHLALVRTHAYLGADVAQTGAPFPVITYSTSGLMSSHMTLFEELASRGYVVLCIGHPYWNPFVYGSGGEVIPFDGQNEYYRAWWAEADSAAVGEAKSQITLARSAAAQERAHLRHNELMPVAVDDLRTWAVDIGFVLDELAAMEQDAGFLAGALDLEHIGIMGFSKGGAAAGQFCVTDARCEAGINLSGFMYGDILNVNLDTPFFFFSEEELWCPDCFVNDLFYKRAESDAYQMKIRGARHASFGDLCLWGQWLQWASGNPTIGGERMTTIQNVYSLAFFDKHLKGLAAPLLEGPSPDYPEVVFKSRHP